MMRSSLTRCALLGGLVLAAAALGACDNKSTPAPAGSGAKTTAAASGSASAKPTASTKATGAAKDPGKLTPKKAAEDFAPHVKKMREICEKNKDDCKKMGEELTKYAGEHAEAIKKSFEAAGGKPAVQSEMDNLGEKFDEDTEVILEHGEMKCAEKDKAVAKALKQLMIMD